MIAPIERIVRASRRLGYRSEAIIRDYPFSTLGSPAAPSTQRAPLAVFTQTPPSYRSAAFGAAVSTEDPEIIVRNFRDLGAPLFFVIDSDNVSVWQVYAGGPPRLIQRAHLEALDRVFDERKDIWAPDSIHRAKSIGRFNSQYQLDFVDIGLIPAIEGEIHEKLDRLLNETLAATREAGVRDGVRNLFQGVFRLLAAKILMDREHQASKAWDPTDVRSVLSSIGDYYGLAETFSVNSVARLLSDSWAVLRAGLNVSNISADDLAFVYENTLVTPETRRTYGTHSTPRHVAEYVVGRLDLWREALQPPLVYEPFAGAGVFLVSALRHLRDGLPSDWTDRQRHNLLVGKIRGSEVDAFACEVAVLSLILADYPNKNGWKVENVDLFKGNALASRLAAADVVLCNPPFEILTSQERIAYPEIAAISGSKAEAVLTLTLRAKPKALGFVLPRTFLMDRAYREQRREIEKNYREIELVSLPDGVFAVSQVETALLIAKGPRISDAQQIVRSSEVDDRDRRAFKFRGLPSRTRQEFRSVSRFEIGSLWIPPLGPLWQRLSTSPRIGDLVDGHWGLRWLHRRQGTAGADQAGENRAPGLLRANDHRQFALGQPLWLDIDPAHLYAGGDLRWSSPKILCNAARLSRGYWRLAAAVDREGLYASQQFVGLWPRDSNVDLDALTAILNGPLANAFMAEHSTEKRFRIRSLLAVPMPASLPHGLGQLAREYASLLQQPTKARRDDQAASLLNQIDELVLDAYDIPPRLCRSLLASFTGNNRPVVHLWEPWSVSLDDPALSLSELRSGLLDRARGHWPKQVFSPVSEDEAAAAAPYLP